MNDPEENERYFSEEILVLYNDLLRFITILSKDRQLAADIVQDTMETVWRKLDQVRSYDSQRVILKTIAKNKLTSYYRKNKIQAHFLLWQDVEEMSQLEEEMIVHMMQQEDRRLLLFLVSRLREDHGRIILLHYFYELSLRDVSEITETNYNTVVSWHKRALKQLGILLSDQNNER